jgi:hypothetical protein
MWTKSANSNVTSSSKSIYSRQSTGNTLSAHRLTNSNQLPTQVATWRTGSVPKKDGYFTLGAIGFLLSYKMTFFHNLFFCAKQPN